MNAAPPRRWLRRLLAVAIAVPAIAAFLWFGNVWRLTRERDRLLAEAAQYGPVLWNDLAAQTLSEHQRNPGAAEEFLAAIARLGGEYGRPLGFPPALDTATSDWLENAPAPPLPDHAVKALARGKDALDRLRKVVGKPPGLLTTKLDTDHPWSILLGHVQDTRNAARMLQLEAVAAEQAGDVRRAYRAALTASLLSRQLERDPCLISWLVASAIENTAARQILPVALRMGKPTAEEFAALDAAWADRGPADRAFGNALRHDIAMMLSVARHPEDWAYNRRTTLRENGRQPSHFELAMVHLEATGAGEPVRLRAEIALLKVRLLFEDHLAAGRDLADLDNHMFADTNVWTGNWRTVIDPAIRSRRSTAYAVRQALRLARQWHDTGKLPDAADGLGLPPLLNAAVPTYERRPRGFTLHIPNPPNTQSRTFSDRDVVVEFPAPKAVAK